MMRARIMSSTAPDRKRSPAPARPRGRLPAVAVLALAACLAPTLVQAAEVKTLKQGEQDLERVKGRIESLNRQIQRDRGEKDELSKALEGAERKLAGAQAQLKRVRGQIAEQNKRIVDTQAQQAEARYRLDQQKQSLARQLRAAYVMGTRSRTQLWLSQEQTAQVGRVMVDYDVLSHVRADQIAAVRSEVDQIAALQNQLIDERSKLEALELEQAQTLETLQASRNERKTTLASIDQRLSAGNAELRQAQADEAALNKLLKSLRDALNDIPLDSELAGKPFTQQKGKLPPPLKGPVLADFGSPKAGGRLSWSGRWIGAPDGTPFRAIARGRVAYTGWLQRYGQILILEHDGGYFSLYGHCASVTPGAGEWVEAGQVVGTAGDSGGHDKTGVYLELRKGTTVLKPSEWLAR